MKRTKKKNTIIVWKEKEAYGVLEDAVRQAAETCLQGEREWGKQVTIYLVSEKEIRRLNRLYRNKNKTTNVLSFEEPSSFPEPETKNRVLGEVCLAPDYIKKHGEDMEYLVLHGVLHLLGYTHKGKNDTIKMETKEKAHEKHLHRA